MAPDIRDLEREFTKNPVLDNCMPLCEAFLEKNRFMEAMVVCKKGIKNTPGDPRGRVLLARIYLEQKKLSRAEKEAQAALAEYPADPGVQAMMGRVLFESDRATEAMPYVQQAIQMAPADPQIQAIAAKLGIQAAPAAPVAQAAPAPGAMPPQQAYPAPGGQPAPGGFAPAPGGQPAPGGFAPPPGGFAPPGGAAAPAPANPFASPGAPAPQPMAQEGSATNQLEHVDDFFASDALGFSNDASHIDTAGPGRLTIVGFVPKTTGSIKLTIGFGLGFFAVAAVFITWVYIDSQNTREINRLFGQVAESLDEDQYPSYKKAQESGLEILKIDPEHTLTLSALAYTYAVLGIEHDEPGALEEARKYLAQAEQDVEAENRYRVSVRAFLGHHDKDYKNAIAQVQAILDKGGSHPLIELEAFRLKYALDTTGKETKIQLRRLIQEVTSRARIFSYLGWYYFNLEDWTRADSYFTKALQNSRGHVEAMLGQSITDFSRAMGLKERQKEIDKTLKKVFATPAGEISQPYLALSHFVRGLLREWQEKQEEADKDFAAAFKLDPNNTLFYYRRGVERLKVGNVKAAMIDLQEAVKRNPDHIDYLRKLAEAQIQAKDFDGADKTLAHGISLAPKNSVLLLLKGERYVAAKKYKEAIAVYKTVKIGENNDPIPFCDAQIGVSTALRLDKQAGKAAQYMEDFLGKAPSGVQPPMQAKLWCELGLDFDGKKEKERALTSFATGIEQFRFYPECHYYLCRSLGRGGEAAQACKSYLALAPRGKYAADATRRSK